MRTWLFVMLLGCGSGQATVTEPAQPQAQAANSPEAIAKAFATAAVSGDVEKAKALTSTYDEVVEVSTNAGSREDFEQQRDSTLKEMSGGGHAVTVTKTGIVKQQTLPAGDKLKHPVDIAYVQFAINDDGEEHEVGFPLLFIKVGDTWKWSPKN